MVWGIPYLLIRIAVRQVEPPTLVFLRTGCAAILLLPFAWRAGGRQKLLSHWRAVVTYTAAELGVSWLFLFRAEQRLSSSLSGLLIAIVPFVSVALAKATGRSERLEWSRIAGLLVGLAGVATLVGVGVRGSQVLSVGEIGVTVVGYAVGPMVIARYLQSVPAVEVVTASLVLTSLVYAPFGLTHLPKRMSPEVLSSVVVLVVICTAIAFLAFFALINEVGPERATVVTFVNPAVAIALGVVLLHEPFTLGVGLGFPLVLAGSFLATRKHRERSGDDLVTPEHLAPETLR